MNKLNLLLALGTSLTLLGCGIPEGEMDPAGELSVSEDELIATGFDINEIYDNDYTLRYPALTFSETESEDIFMGEGTPHETRMRVFTKYYQELRQVQRQNVSDTDEYCKIYAVRSDDTSAEDVILSPGKLKKGKIIKKVSRRNETIIYDFSLPLQYGWEESFFLQCFNTPDSWAVRRHIGHLFQIQNPKFFKGAL